MRFAPQRDSLPALPFGFSLSHPLPRPSPALTKAQKVFESGDIKATGAGLGFESHHLGELHGAISKIIFHGAFGLEEPIPGGLTLVNPTTTSRASATLPVGWDAMQWDGMGAQQAHNYHHYY